MQITSEQNSGDSGGSALLLSLCLSRGIWASRQKKKILSTQLTNYHYSRRAVVSSWRKYAPDYLGGLHLPRKSVVRLTDRSDMTLAVGRGRKQ